MLKNSAPCLYSFNGEWTVEMDFRFFSKKWWWILGISWLNTKWYRNRGTYWFFIKYGPKEGTWEMDHTLLQFWFSMVYLVLQTTGFWEDLRKTCVSIILRFPFIETILKMMIFIIEDSIILKPFVVEFQLELILSLSERISSSTSISIFKLIVQNVFWVYTSNWTLFYYI